MSFYEPGDVAAWKEDGEVLERGERFWKKEERFWKEEERFWKEEARVSVMQKVERVSER